MVASVPAELTRPLRRDVLRPHQRVQELAADEPPGCFAVCAYDGAELVAVGLVAPDGEPGGWRVRGMATLPASRGRGAGTAVLEALIAHAREHGATRIWCNARAPALAFYERSGFRVVSEEFELENIGPHRVMERSGAAP